VASRFEETNPVFKHMEIFDTRQCPLEGVQVAAGEVFDEKGDTPAAAFVNDFGNESIEPLARHYSQLVVQLKYQLLLLSWWKCLKRKSWRYWESAWCIWESWSWQWCRGVGNRRLSSCSPFNGFNFIFSGSGVGWWCECRREERCDLAIDLYFIICLKRFQY
jgi:hypothetical protein